MLFAVEVKLFIGTLRLRWVLVWGPTIGSLNLPLITTINIVGRERSPAYKNQIKQSLNDYAQ
jgi:hypothetical protein